MAYSKDDLLSDAVRQLLTAQCTPQVVRNIEAGQSARPLWQLIEASGFADALVGEAQGGAGLDLSAAYPVLELCGAFALPVPLGETMLARGLLAQAGVAVPPGSIALGDAVSGKEGGVVCGNVHGGQVADWVLVAKPTMRDVAQGAVHGSGQSSSPSSTVGPTAGNAPHAASLLLPVSQAKKSAAGFCLDANLQWPEVVVAKAPLIQCSYDVKELQACLYAAQLAGAMQAVFTRTLQYANDRNQFGRPIGKFQAIQHQLSVMAEHAFAARMAAQMGCRSSTFMPDRLCVAVAKARTSEAAVEVAALAHSIHGAIGFTQEFDLQIFTRRLHLWRQAGGAESYWHTVLGEALVDQHQGLALDLIRSVTDAPSTVHESTRKFL
jgi:acyl-CoA dehydrogenase